MPYTDIRISKLFPGQSIHYDFGEIKDTQTLRISVHAVGVADVQVSVHMYGNDNMALNDAPQVGNHIQLLISNCNGYGTISVSNTSSTDSLDLAWSVDLE